MWRIFLKEQPLSAHLPSRALRVWAALLPVVLAIVLGACHRPEPVAQSPVIQKKSVTTAQAADPVLVKVDLSEVLSSQVHERLAQLPVSLTPADAAVQALLAATADVLIVREMGVLKEQRRPGETFGQAADRFLTTVWKPDATCNLDRQDLKWTYLRDLGKYKHPTSYAIWDAQGQCCPDVDDCPLLKAEQCRQELRPVLTQMHADIALAFKALSQPADVTSVAFDQSPWRALHVPTFERIVSQYNQKDSRVQLRRYTFFAQGEPGFEKARFRPGEPHMAELAKRAKPGQLLGPVDTEWGIDVALLVGLEPAMRGLADADVEAQVREKACGELAQRSRNEYRERLLAGAQILWQRPAIEADFGKLVLGKLPADASQRDLPYRPLKP